jgi:hypothetical protein
MDENYETYQHSTHCEYGEAAAQLPPSRHMDTSSPSCPERVRGRHGVLTGTAVVERVIQNASHLVHGLATLLKICLHPCGAPLPSVFLPRNAAGVLLPTVDHKAFLTDAKQQQALLELLYDKVLTVVCDAPIGAAPPRGAFV